MSTPTRRAVLIGGAVATAALVVGCSGDADQPGAVPVEPTAPPEPDQNLLDELTLIGAYLGAIETFPNLRGTLTTIADQHRAHARELGASEADLTAIEPITPRANNIRPAVTELIKLERAAAQLRADSTAGLEDGEAVRVLTFIAASEASHVPELQDVRRALKDGS
ncbi:MAG TPA: ferritin-like domain-containing protein [Candidatus Nanopelagicales bacterium]|nr:ferritin-like domain-containing protein [Candidatus Nanopelagicales bacterium]